MAPSVLFRRRRSPLLAVPFVILVACGGPGGDAVSGEGAAAEGSAAEGLAVGGSSAVVAAAAVGSATAEAPVLGTVEATLGGEARRWYVVSGEAMDGPYASGAWMGAEEDGYTIAVGGLDSEDPPIETFSRGEVGQWGVGDYEGSSLTLMFPVPAEGGTGRYDIDETTSTAQVAYVPDASVMELSQIFMMVQGVVEIEAAEVQDGRARARGTFSGTLRRMPDGETLEVVEGRFELEGLPSVDAIQPGGGGGGGGGGSGGGGGD